MQILIRQRINCHTCDSQEFRIMQTRCSVSKIISVASFNRQNDKYAPCLRKTCQIIFALLWSNMDRFQYKKMVGMSWKIFNKTMQKSLTLPKISASTTFGNLK